MNLRPLVLLVLMVFLPSVCQSQNHTLEFVKQIGVGTETNKFVWMSFVSFSADGMMVASDGPSAPDDASMNLTVWTFPDGKLVKRFPFEPEVLSPDWRYCATEHGVVELGTGKMLAAQIDNTYLIHAFSPDSHFVAESSHGKQSEGLAISVRELPSGKQVATFGNHGAFSLAISPDGTTLAAGHWNVVVLWNLTTGRKLATLRGFGRYVTGLAFDRSGKLLAAATDAGAVQLWDAERCTRIHAVHIEGGDVSQPVFSPDGTLMAVGIYGTGTVYVFDVATGKLLDKEKVSDLGCGSVAFSPDGNFLITPSTGGLVKSPNDRAGTIRVFRVEAP